MGFMDKLKEMVETIKKSHVPFDPSRFNDEVATKTSWSPAKGGGTNVGTHKLREVNARRVEFKARGVALLFPGIFMFIGLGVSIAFAFGTFEGDQQAVYFGIPFGFVFFLVGFLLLRSWTSPRVFDLGLGFYWRGNREPSPINRAYNKSKAKDVMELKDVHAVQLIKERCTSSSSNGGRSSYYSYEINLVAKDGQRVNVVDHGKLALIRSDAESLSKFLKVPLWDAI